MNTVHFFTVDAVDLQALQRHWQNLTASYAGSQQSGDALFHKLVEHYSEAGRAYHNLSHIKALLAHSEAHEKLIHNLHAVSFAIWFHDAIYDTRAGDNEERSARLAAAALTEFGVSDETSLLVQEMISATKDHQAGGLSLDARLFLDLDLAILGTKEAMYREYSRAIRREYSWVPEALYKEGRQTVLRSFLERQRIYFTDQMAAPYEAQARRNIAREIEELKEKNRPPD
jgi:predicted metal-dependent HD superfamily phosphohydrolase